MFLVKFCDFCVNVRAYSHVNIFQLTQCVWHKPWTPDVLGFDSWAGHTKKLFSWLNGVSWRGRKEVFNFIWACWEKRWEVCVSWKVERKETNGAEIWTWFSFIMIFIFCIMGRYKLVMNENEEKTKRKMWTLYEQWHSREKSQAK